MSSLQSKSLVISSANNQVNSLVLTGDKHGFQSQESFIFPLFAELSGFIHLPQFLYFIEMILLILQEMGITMWCGSKHMENKDGSFFRVIYSFSDWGVSSPNSGDCVVQYSIAYAIFFFTTLFLIFVAIYYEKKRVFNHFQLTIIKFLLYPLLTIILPVYASFFGKLFVQISTNSDSLTIVHFVFIIIVLIISLIQSRYAYIFATNTPLLDRSLLGSWDDSIIFFTTLTLCYGTFLSQILDLFAKWLHIIAIIGYGILVGYRYYYLSFLPMFKIWVNTFFMATCVMSIANLLFSIIRLSTGIPEFVYILIAFISFIGGLIFFSWWCNKKKEECLNNITCNPSTNDAETRNNIIQEHFYQLTFSSELDALRHLHIGLAAQSERIIDISFPKFLTENFEYPSIIFAAAQVAAFFPSQRPYLSSLLNKISKYKNLSFAQTFLLNQIRRIHVIRQTTVSGDASMKLDRLQKMSRDTISQVRGFWGEILNAKTDISFASLRYLRTESIKTESTFLDACDQYPNNPSILEEYCRFQIEALGDFQGATNSGRKAAQITPGKKSIDSAFKALVNVYPQFLVNNVMTIYGDDKTQQGYDLATTSTNSLSSFTSLTSFTDKVIIEKKSEPIVSHNKLRIALQNRLKSTKLKSLSLASALSLIQLLVYVCIYLFLIFYLPQTSYHANDFLHCCHELSKMTLNLEYIGCICSVQLVICYKSFGGISTMKQLLNIKTSDLNQNASLLIQPLVAMSRAITQYQIQYESLLNILMGELHSYAEHFSDFYLKNTDYLLDNKTLINTTLRASLVYYLYLAETVASYSLINRYNSPFLFSIVQNINTLYISLQNFLDSISLYGDLKLVKDNEMIRIISLSCGLVLFIAFLIPRVINIVLISKESKKCSDLLRQTDPQIIKESYKPLSFPNKNFKTQPQNSKESIIGNNIHSAHDSDLCIIIYFIIILFTLLINAAFLFLSTYFYCKELDLNTNIYSWLSDGMVQFSSLFNSLNVICGTRLELMTVEEGNHLLRLYIDNLTNSRISIDMTLLGANNTFNDFYFMHPNLFQTGLSNFADYITSLSLNNKINIAASSIQNFVDQNPTLQKLNDNNFASLIFLIDNYLYDDLLKFQDMLIDYSKFHFDHGKTLLLYFTISGLIICILMYVIEQFSIRAFKQSVDAMKQLISMLPPVAVVTSTPWMNFLNNGQNYDDVDVNMSVYDSILSATSNAAILLDNKYIIQFVNPAVHDFTGFTSDQILGQSITYLFPIIESDTNQDLAVNQQLYDILNKQENLENLDNSPSEDSSLNDVSLDQEESSAEIETGFRIIKIKCMTENGSLIPTQVIILRIEDGLNENDQYALILRDLSKEQNEKREIEEAKEKSEQLFKALFPVNCVNINKEYEVDFGTVILIEICGLADYIDSLLPDQLINNLKTIYNSFEKQTEKYQAVKIVKKDSGIFMACLGLFDYVPESEQAYQAVMYCHAMIEEIENINEDSNIDIHLKTGINSGGPLIGRIVGEANPLFEILGPVIELASQIQCEGCQDEIQISESTKNLLDSQKFNIQEEKEFLERSSKKQQVYIVSPI